MHPSRSIVAAIAPLLLLSAAAHAQFSIPSFTIDSGGGTLSGGTFTLVGTIAQPDASQPLTGGSYTATGGFWPGLGSCPPDFNGDGSVSVQDIFDFLAGWFASNPLSDFNGAGGITVQDIFDFIAAWFSGC